MRSRGSCRLSRLAIGISFTLLRVRNRLTGLSLQANPGWSTIYVTCVKMLFTESLPLQLPACADKGSFWNFQVSSIVPLRFLAANFGFAIDFLYLFAKSAFQYLNIQSAWIARGIARIRSVVPVSHWDFVHPLFRVRYQMYRFARQTLVG